MTFGLEGLFVELLVWLIPARALIELTDESFESIDGRYKAKAYKDIRAIYFAKSVHLRDHDKLSPRYVIVFKNGCRWHSFGSTAEIPFEEQTAVARFVAQRSGHKIVSVNFVEEIPN